MLLRPPKHPPFFFAVKGLESTLKLADVFYKSNAADLPATLKMPDGATIALKNLSRKTAIGVVRKHEKSLQDGKALLDLGEAPSQNQKRSSLVQEAISRLDSAELIPKMTREQTVRFETCASG
jgi:hypothetical protein